jgi:hypothetical protein
MAKQPRDIGASVRARLLNLAREKGQAFDLLLTRYATDATKQRQWAAFVRDLAADVPSLETIVNDLAGFLMPHARQARQQREAAAIKMHG